MILKFDSLLSVLALVLARLNMNKILLCSILILDKTIIEGTALNFMLISIWSIMELPLAAEQITSDHRYGLQIKFVNCNATQVLKHNFLVIISV
jgi:hypothetical protein